MSCYSQHLIQVSLDSSNHHWLLKFVLVIIYKKLCLQWTMKGLWFEFCKRSGIVWDRRHVNCCQYWDLKVRKYSLLLFFKNYVVLELADLSIGHNWSAFSNEQKAKLLWGCCVLVALSTSSFLPLFLKRYFISLPQLFCSYPFGLLSTSVPWQSPLSPLFCSQVLVACFHKSNNNSFWTVWTPLFNSFLVSSMTGCISVVIDAQVSD